MSQVKQYGVRKQSDDTLVAEGDTPLEAVQNWLSGTNWPDDAKVTRLAHMGFARMGFIAEIFEGAPFNPSFYMVDHTRDLPAQNDQAREAIGRVARADMEASLSGHLPMVKGDI